MIATFWMSTYSSIAFRCSNFQKRTFSFIVLQDYQALKNVNIFSFTVVNQEKASCQIKLLLMSNLIERTEKGGKKEATEQRNSYNPKSF